MKKMIFFVIITMFFSIKSSENNRAICLKKEDCSQKFYLLALPFMHNKSMQEVSGIILIRFIKETLILLMLFAMLMKFL